MKSTVKYLAGIAGPSGYGSKSTAEQVTLDFHLPFSSSSSSSSSTPSPLTAIITGATSGIGVETARVLAKRGVRVVIAARDINRANQIKQSILQNESPADLEILVMELDLSSFASITSFSHQFLSLGLPLHILMYSLLTIALHTIIISGVSGNNAGIFSHNLEFSEDKVEMTFATNYLGHFLLTELLMEKMIETAEESGIHGRIINLSSAIHSWVKRDSFSFQKMINPTKYNGTRAYAQTKLAAILHAKELSRQLKARNAKVTANAVHPGIIKTGIIRAHKGFLTDSVYFIASKLLKTVPQGASTTCYVALSPKTEGVGGKYFADCNESNCSALGNDEAEAIKLWHHTRALIHRRLQATTASTSR
ncbi:Short-chain dehydrogenase TIC 32 B, chloroplastic [Linum perenne]